MFAKRFFKVGEKLDDAICKLKMWNAQRVWYSPYAYFKIKKMIKKNEFDNDEHFSKFMKVATSHIKISDKHYKKLCEVYFWQ